DLVQRGLRLLGELFAGVGVELDVHAVLDRELIRQCPDRRREALIAQDDRLQVEREIAKLTDRRSVSHERSSDDLARLLVASLRNRVQASVEQQRDSGQ